MCAGSQAQCHLALGSGGGEASPEVAEQLVSGQRQLAQPIQLLRRTQVHCTLGQQRGNA